MKQDKWKEDKYTPSYTSTIARQYHTIIFLQTDPNIIQTLFLSMSLAWKDLNENVKTH